MQGSSCFNGRIYECRAAHNVYKVNSNTLKMNGMNGEKRHYISVLHSNMVTYVMHPYYIL